MTIPRGGLLLVAILLTPFASAGGSVPVWADMDLHAQVDLRGDASIRSVKSALDLSPSWGLDGPLVSWGRAHGSQTTYTKQNWDLGVAGAGLTPARMEGEGIRTGAGSLENLTCAQECTVLIHAGGASALGLRGEASGALAWTEGATVFAAYADQPGLPTYRFPRGTPLASTRPGPGLMLEGHAFAEGPVGLLLWNVSGEIHADGKVTRFETGTSYQRSGGPAGLPVGLTVRTSFIELVLDGASFLPGIAASLYAPHPSIELEGALDARDASGLLRVAGRERELDHAALSVAGRLILTPQAEQGLAGLHGTGPVADAERRVEVEGRATSVILNGMELAGPARAAAPALVAVTGAGILVSVGALLIKSALAPFYTRVARSEVLSNENRRKIFESIRARPGVSAADLSRESGLARVVIQHHLRMLEAHQFIVDRRTGRTGAYFPAGVVTDTQSVVVHETLRDQTRRALASAIAARRALLTQRDLVESTGLSQRLVSYHLSRLEQSGLIVGEGQMPRRYSSTRLLEVALGLPPTRLAS